MTARDRLVLARDIAALAFAFGVVLGTTVLARGPDRAPADVVITTARLR
ncbi:hypothetical protein [Rhodoplanes roseus]|nr:hypothetical protein [Rhodoplanes roseus]